jgi:hypothetical protein
MRLHEVIFSENGGFYTAVPIFARKIRKS